ncbi:MAG TPA: ABC transporter ATP-binding protein [Candidatus Dormibacteraeota bacterium]
MASALAFAEASKRYRNGKLALDSVSFAIDEGARACLLGPNGAGKSTAIRLLEGALAPTGGRVWLLGEEVGTPWYLEARRRTGVVPQGPGMYPDLSAGEYLGYVRRLYGRGDLDAVVEVFGLGDQLRTRMAQLSGGFQRRLTLAGALLGEPELLLLDEPTVGLDPVATRDVHDYLATVMRQRSTLLCTHNLAEAEKLCDEVVILSAGKVLVHKPLAQLRRESRPRLRLAARQGAEAVLAALKTRGLTAEADGEAVVLAANDARAEAPALLRALLAEGLDVYECTPLEASLETMFLEAVEGRRS